MRLISIGAACVIVLCAVGSWAQELPPRPSAEWKYEGDSVESFKATLVLSPGIEQASARGVVNAYIALTRISKSEFRSSTRMSKRWEELAGTSRVSAEEKLLTKELVQTLAKAKKEEREKVIKQYGEFTEEQLLEAVVQPQLEISVETVVNDKTTRIEVVEKPRVQDKDEPAEPVPSADQWRKRFTCEKGDDGKWRIGKIEAWTIQPGAEGKGRDWQDDKWMALNCVFDMGEIVTAVDVATEPVQSAPEDAARSVITWLLANEESRHAKFAKMQWDARRSLMLGLITAALLAEIKTGQTKNPLPMRPKTAPEVDSVTDGDDGQKFVKFKRRNDKAPTVQLTLVKAKSGKWMISAAGYWLNQEDGRPPVYESFSDIYQINVR